MKNGKYIQAREVADLLDALRERGLTLGTAESCTAGMIAARVADIPGSSDVLLGGIVSYANEVKKAVLGVRDETLEKHGAVSERCAAEMAAGARRALGCDVAVAVTGIAGPGGGSAAKPVGTVCFGLADGEGVSAWTERFPRDSGRAAIRKMTVAAALRAVAAKIR